ncbi:MAG: TraM recognition domain-containing protein [Candidatus Falkowbacteria bacterium]
MPIDFQPSGGAANLVLEPQSYDLMPLVITMVIVIAVFVIAMIVFAIIRGRLRKTKHLQQALYLIRLPKEQEEEDDKNNKGAQHMHAQIAKSETIIEAIGGLKAQRGWRAWLGGREDIFSLEIVAQKGLINFYFAAPQYAAQYMEKQIQAHYPDASVEKVDDYNIFTQHNFAAAGFLMTKRPFALPIRTYIKEEVDSLNSVLNVMSKMADNESLAVQITLRSARSGWHKEVSKIVRRAYKSNNLEFALKYNALIGAIQGVDDAMQSKEVRDQNKQQYQRQLTAMEQDVLKNIEEKNSKAGLDVNIRLVACSPSQQLAEHYLFDLASVFGQYNYFEYGNSFLPEPLRQHEDQTISDFIHRRFNERISFILNTEEVASLFHLPMPEVETPNINWLSARGAAAPVETPKEGLILGFNDYRGEQQDIRIKVGDRMRHIYIIGKSGVGKSFLMANMAIQDIHNGDGCCVLDPHGDLVDDILERIPANRANDVVIFAPADLARPIGLNLLEFDPRYPEQKSFVINEMIGIFDKLYDLKATGGPIFEQYMRNAMLLVMADPESGSTLLEIPRVLSDPDFRNLKLSRCADHTVVNFWVNEAEKAGGDAALANIVPYITSKLTSFISNDMMRPIIGQQNTAFNLRDIMDSSKILLVKLPKGLVGELNAYLLGMILVGKILMAALSRADSPKASRNPFYLYIDEFQNFTTDSITQVLSEARKYGLSLTLAHQYIGQLTKHNDTSIKDAVFGNVGTIIAFKVGPEDGEFLEKAFRPQFSAADLINVDKYTAYVRLLIDNMNARPFTMKTRPLYGASNLEVAKAITEASRMKYGTDRELVEAEIRLRMSNL